MALDMDALNYPYIRIRDVEWLKRTLLVFPHVARIAPSYGAPKDSDEVAKFCRLEGRRGSLLRNVDLDKTTIWDDQSELMSRISNTLEADRRGFLHTYGREATLGNIDLARESADVWDDRSAAQTFQLHNQKVVANLLAFLFQHNLAWHPWNSHGEGYVEMHPRLGEAVLSTLAFACAKSEGLSLVTEFPKIYGRTIHRSKEEIFDSLLNIAPEHRTSTQVSVPESLVEFVIHHRCDASKLTPENLVALNKDWTAIGAFKESLEKLAADIPPGIDDPRILHQRLKEKADHIFSRWKEDNKSLQGRLKDLFSGDGDEAAKVLEKLLEKAVGGEAVSGTTGGGYLGWLTGGGLTSHTVLGAAAGLALGVVIRTGRNALAARKKRKEDPLRYLTIMEKAGVSYVASA
jgi:hypothetical protein